MHLTFIPLRYINAGDSGVRGTCTLAIIAIGFQPDYTGDKEPKFNITVVVLYIG